MNNFLLFFFSFLWFINSAIFSFIHVYFFALSLILFMFLFIFFKHHTLTHSLTHQGIYFHQFLPLTIIWTFYVIHIIKKKFNCDDLVFGRPFLNFASTYALDPSVFHPQSHVFNASHLCYNSWSFTLSFLFSSDNVLCCFSNNNLLKFNIVTYISNFQTSSNFLKAPLSLFSNNLQNSMHVFH